VGPDANSSSKPREGRHPSKDPLLRNVALDFAGLTLGLSLEGYAVHADPALGDRSRAIQGGIHSIPTGLTLTGCMRYLHYCNAQVGPTMDRKPLIFISHIKEEKDLAFALKELVTDKFLNMMEVFVATDPTSIEMGREWLQRIKAALKTCAVEIIFASPESVKRPWINFEAGAAWIRKNVPVIPLCHSGMLTSFDFLYQVL